MQKFHNSTLYHNDHGGIRMKKISGLALIAIGVFHSLVAVFMPGAIGFSGIWQEIADAGIIDAVKPESLRIWGYYWFLISGLCSILLGVLCHWIEQQLQRLPLLAGGGLLAIASFGILLDSILASGWCYLLP
jgi:hypothetical protein